MARTPPPHKQVLPGAPPKFHGVSPTARDPVVSKYTQGLAARARAAGGAAKGEVHIPDLGIAASSYRPEKDGPMTLGQVAQSQENVRRMSNPTSGAPEKKGLSPDTIAGLKHLHDQAAAMQKPPGEAAAPATTTAAPDAPASSEKEKKSVTKMGEDERQRLAEMSDLDFDLMMSRVRSDIINNAEERKAVEARLPPLDLADGLITGEFQQLVPVVDGKLEVMFRTITPFENEIIRRHILSKVLEERDYSQVHQDNYSFMQVVAAVKMMNGRELPSHLTSVGKGKREFDMDVFMKKYEMFTNYPGPLIHALSVHANWFDLRVRTLFSSNALKNG